MKMSLNFVSDGELSKITTVTGKTLKEVFENATEYLAGQGYIPDDDTDELKWEKGDEKGTYWLTVEDESTGLDIDFELEKEQD